MCNHENKSPTCCQLFDTDTQYPAKASDPVSPLANELLYEANVSKLHTNTFNTAAAKHITIAFPLTFYISTITTTNTASTATKTHLHTTAAATTSTVSCAPVILINLLK